MDLKYLVLKPGWVLCRENSFPLSRGKKVEETSIQLQADVQGGKSSTSGVYSQFLPLRVDEHAPVIRDMLLDV